MLCILSSAKTFCSTASVLPINTIEPLLVQKTNLLLQKLQLLSESDLQALLHVSPKLTRQNYARYQSWDQTEPIPALHAYNGDVFKTLKNKPLITENWHHANAHIVILSGLYGILRPTDGIKPHRLEMATKTQNIIDQNLYQYWKDAVTQMLNLLVKNTGTQYVLNLASHEYFSVINTAQITVPIIDTAFKQRTTAGLRTVAIHAKKARGAMARYVLDNPIQTPESLQEFIYDGYTYADDMSTDNTLMFIK